MARIAYYTNSGMSHLMPDGTMGYTVAIVEEGATGYWIHSDVFFTPEAAKLFADEQNTLYGYTDEDVLEIVASSMKVGVTQ